MRASYVNDEFRVSVRFLQAVHRRVANCNDEDLTLTALARMGKYARRGFRPPSKWRDIVCSPHTSQAKSANMFDVPVDFVMNSCDKLEWLRYDKDGNYKRPVPTLPHDMYVYQQRRGLNRSTQDYRDIDRFVDTGIHIYLKNVKVWSAFVRLSDEQIDLVVDALRNYTGPEQNTAEIIASIDDPVMRSNGINVDFQGASLPPKGTVCDITMNFVATEATKETYLGENEGESLFDTQEELLMWPNPSVSC
ncbi:MAG: hypothetical protein CMK92_00820 [Pseudomonas sp.]|nr:hypothetical protein [Pseudomonas sp.]